MFWLSSSCWALWRWTGGMKTPNLRIKEKSILWFVSFWDPIMYVGRKCAEMPFSADLAYFTSVCCLIVRGWPTVIRWFTLLTKCNRSVRCFFSFSSYILLLAHRKQRLYHKCLMRDTSGLHTYIQNGVHGRCKWWGASTCSALSIDFYGITKYGLETVLYCIWHTGASPFATDSGHVIRVYLHESDPLWAFHSGSTVWNPRTKNLGFCWFNTDLFSAINPQQNPPNWCGNFAHRFYIADPLRKPSSGSDPCERVLNDGDGNTTLNLLFDNLHSDFSLMFSV